MNGDNIRGVIGGLIGMVAGVNWFDISVAILLAFTGGFMGYMGKQLGVWIVTELKEWKRRKS